ncbi:MAG: 30S ribosomal protein S19e [Candidatus Diapherotrites archaeon]
MNPFDVPANELINTIAEDLKTNLKVEQPAFASFVKTAPSRERVPQQKDWYYTRLASILYRLLKEGTLGTGALRTYYGGRKNRGRRKHKFRRAGGKIIRYALQQLESLGLVKKVQKGRTLTPKGHSYLSRMALKTKKRLEEKQSAKKDDKSALEKAQAVKSSEDKSEEKSKKKAEIVSELKEKLAENL